MPIAVCISHHYKINWCFHLLKGEKYIISAICTSASYFMSNVHLCLAQVNLNNLVIFIPTNGASPIQLHRAALAAVHMPTFVKHDIYFVGQTNPAI